MHPGRTVAFERVERKHTCSILWLRHHPDCHNYYKPQHKTLYSTEATSIVCTMATSELQPQSFKMWNHYKYCCTVYV